MQTGLLEGEVETNSVLDQKLPSLSVVRLTGDEVEFRPIPLVGDMAETSPATVAAAVGVRQSGPYNSFTLTPESAGQEFVVSEASQASSAFAPCWHIAAAWLQNMPLQFSPL